MKAGKGRMKPPVSLNEREQVILQAVINSYVAHAEPVGSRTVVKRFGLNLSAATVRNVMADLEEQGYLQQVHTSSGRIPTDAGYRYYVDYLMKVQRLTQSERRRIDDEFKRQLSDVDGVLRHTSQLLALVSHQAGLVEALDMEQAKVQRFELMRISDDRVAVLIVDNFGSVHTLPTTVKASAGQDQLSSLSNFLNCNFQGMTLGTLSGAIRGRLGDELAEQRDLAHSVLDILDTMPQRRGRRLFLEGAVQLFEQPEFQSIDQAREVFGLLDEHDRLISLLRKAVSEDGGPAVFISQEKDDTVGVEDIGVVAAPYHVDGKPVGLIGILGPRRMPYSKLTAIVQHTSEVVGRFLTRLMR
ncbi:MAG: heat-inducible transcription repressor HrcA [Candidatus Hydrogenedens sp.]|jgi:heat-inducible transcriptional repressor|nr:heat-inducible transcription repressor HrcA [Candidatus Hydrogenedens sp.]